MDGYDYPLEGPLEIAQLALLQVPSALGATAEAGGSSGSIWETAWDWGSGLIGESDQEKAQRISKRIARHQAGEGPAAPGCPGPFTLEQWVNAFGGAPVSAISTLYQTFRGSQGEWFAVYYPSVTQFRMGNLNALRNLALGGADCATSTTAGARLRKAAEAFAKQYGKPGAVQYTGPVATDPVPYADPPPPTDQNGWDDYPESNWWDDYMERGTEILYDAGSQRVEREVRERLGLEPTVGQRVATAGIGFPGGAAGLLAAGALAIFLLRK